MSLSARWQTVLFPAALLALTLPGPASAQGEGDPPVGATAGGRLPGGARLVLLEAPELRPANRVQGLLLFSVGAVHEPAGCTGLLEVLVTALRMGGSVLYDGPGLDAWLERNDATLEITSSPNGLELAFGCPATSLDGLLDRIASLLTTPAYPARAVEAARKLVLERLERERTDPNACAERVVREVALGTTCAWARCASPTEVQGVTRGEVRAFHRAHLGPSNLWVGLAHGGELGPARERLQRMVASLPRAGAPIAPREPTFGSGAQGPIWVVDLPGLPHVELRVAVAAPPRPEQAAALELWLAALEHAGAGDAALEAALRHIDELRFEPLFARRQLHPLGWIAAGRASVEQAPAALSSLMELLSGDLKREVSDELLEPARGVQPAPRNALDQLRERVLDDAAEISVEQRVEAERSLRELEAEPVQLAVRTRLPPRPPVLVVVGPARDLVERLEQIAPVLLFSGQADPAGTPEGLALRARLLEAMGGVGPWARLGGVSFTGEVTYRGSERALPVRLWRDLLGRRLRLEHTQNSVRTTIVVTPQTAWGRSIQATYDLPREQWERTLFRERRQLVRVLHDLASDPRLESRRGSGGRLEIYSKQEMLCWIELDELDRPARLGYLEPLGEQALYTFEDWIEVQGCLWPSRVSQPLDGTVFLWSRFSPSAALDGELFERPAR